MKERDHRHAVLANFVQQAIPKNEHLPDCRIVQFRNDATTFRKHVETCRRVKSLFENLECSRA